MISAAPSIRIAIVDDDALTRQALGHILGTATGLDVAWSAGSGAEAIRMTMVEPDAADVVLLDMNMPEMDGIETAGELRRIRPELPVVMLTTFDSTRHIAAALAVGASGFLVKDATPARLVAAVRAAHHGIRVFTPEAAQMLMAPQPSPAGNGGVGVGSARPAATGLTAKELAVLQLVAQSLTNAQVARRLHVSEATVKAHVSSIITKLDCTDRVGMVMWAFRHGHLS